MAERHDRAAATRRERTRRQIISRSRPLLDEHSPHDLTHTQIAGYVGSAYGTVKEYFPNLSALAVEAYMRSTDKVLQRIQEATAQDARTKLTTTFIELTALFVRHPSLAAAFLDIAEEPEEIQHPTYIAITSHLEGAVDAFLDENPCRKQKIRQPGVHYLHTIIDWTSENFMRHDTPDPDEIEAFAHRTVTYLGR